VEKAKAYVARAREAETTIAPPATATDLVL
jgi:hypothetical protein